MLLAYIDEIGETGAFVSHDHPKFKTSPAFGYAGFVLPAEHARRFGAEFTRKKRELFRTDIGEQDAATFERKGAEMFRPPTLEKFPQHVRVFNSLVNSLRKMDGALFYYADEKPLGTPKQTNLDVVERETAAMRETLNRLARHARVSCDAKMLVMIDQINEKTRVERLHTMYGHIFSRSARFEEMNLLVEPPMHIDSRLSANIQFADWVAAYVTRAIDYQLIDESKYGWCTNEKACKALRGAFTYDSKLHLWSRSIKDFHHSEVLNRVRVVHPRAQGRLLAEGNAEFFRKVKAAAERAEEREKARG